MLFKTKHPLPRVVTLITVFALCAATPIVAQIGAEDPSVDSVAAANAPLHTSVEPLELTLIADFKQLRKDRDQDSDLRPALMVLPNGDTTALEVQTRGNFRLNKRNCSFPPIRLDFKRGDMDGTVFESQNRLKLVSPCKDDDDEFEQYILQEYLVYRINNVLTDLSFRARLARMTFVDTSGDKEPFTKWTFIIENDDFLAARTGWKILKLPQVPPEYIDPDQMMLVEVFQYMIGNTDWNPNQPNPNDPSDCCHNQKNIGSMAGPVFSLPYDFDFTGIVNAKYAKPDGSLRIRKVRDRLNRGWCRAPGELQPTFDLFNAKKAEIYAVYDEVPELDPEVKQKTIEYLDEFYEIINDPKEIRDEFERKCRDPATGRQKGDR
jgi:hypothetical protein